MGESREANVFGGETYQKAAGVILFEKGLDHDRSMAAR
jgi:hypothetical protein